MGANQGPILGPGQECSPTSGCGGTPCPVISDMCGDIGGAWSSAVPFNRVGSFSPAHRTGKRQGRACPAGWTRIVPPAASSATRVFHRYYQDFGQAPNFFRQGDASHQRTCVRGFGS
jgi:nitric oxide synthase oxygenase domain/subunit